MIDLDKPGDFVGRAALEAKAKSGPRRRLTGVVIDGAPMTTNQHPWPATANGAQVGTVRAVAYFPRLERTIGIALRDSGHADPDCAVVVHGEQGERGATVASLPIVTRSS